MKYFCTVRKFWTFELFFDWVRFQVPGILPIWSQRIPDSRLFEIKKWVRFDIKCFKWASDCLVRFNSCKIVARLQFLAHLQQLKTSLHSLLFTMGFEKVILQNGPAVARAVKGSSVTVHCTGTSLSICSFCINRTTSHSTSHWFNKSAAGELWFIARRMFLLFRCDLRRLIVHQK